MATTLYLLRHAATAANLDRPYKLQGRRTDQPLAPIGVRQAELTRDLLAMRRFDRIIASPLRRAMQTAEIIASTRRLPIHTEDALIECDVGEWEGLSWDDVKRLDHDAYTRFHLDPAAHPYLGGESFSQVDERARPCLERLLTELDGQTILVVSHHIVNRVYLAGLLGLPPARAKLVKLDNCGISIVMAEGKDIQLATLNAAFHLQSAGLAGMISRQYLVALLLGLVAGYVDAYAVLNFQVYASFMSGNTTQTGVQLGQGAFAGAFQNLLPIPLFVLGVFLGCLLVHSGWLSSRRWLLGPVAILLAGTLAIAQFAPSLATGQVILLSLAMGILNTAVTRVGEQPISLGYVTGTLNNLAQHLALAMKSLSGRAPGEAGGHVRGAALLAGLWSAFLLGAVLAGWAMTGLTNWTLLPPTVLAAILGLLREPRTENATAAV